MILTNKQEEGLKLAVERHRNGEKYTVIAGYAGTGKSTLVRFIIEALGVEENRVCYTSFTGKAAEVLRKKGNKNAMTLHKLLYDSVPKPAGGFYRKPKAIIEYDVIVVDEVSMVPKSLMDLLFKHRCYVLCLGDPFQLPVIDKDEDNHLLDNPHIFLDEIMRQAADNEIIRLSMDIREQKPLQLFKGNNIQVINKSQVIDGMYVWADEVLVAKNATRININKTMRKMKDFSGLVPREGDKLICLRNYWDEFSQIEKDPLVNGSIGYIVGPVSEENIYFPKFAKTMKSFTRGYRFSLVTESGDIFENIVADKDMLLGGEYSLDWRDSYKLNRLKNRIGDIAPKQFAYGYAITCHKSQGSEWDKVLVIEENFPFDKTEHARWLYTACTRAADKLVLVRN